MAALVGQLVEPSGTGQSLLRLTKHLDSDHSKPAEIRDRPRMAKAGLSSPMIVSQRSYCRVGKRFSRSKAAGHISCWNLFDRRAGDDCTVDVRELFIAQKLCNIGGLTARGRPRIVAVRGIDRVDASGAGNNVIVL